MVEFQMLWNREGGKWRMVAAITEPRPGASLRKIEDGKEGREQLSERK